MKRLVCPHFRCHSWVPMLADGEYHEWRCGRGHTACFTVFTVSSGRYASWIIDEHDPPPFFREAIISVAS